MYDDSKKTVEEREPEKSAPVDPNMQTIDMQSEDAGNNGSDTNDSGYKIQTEPLASQYTIIETIGRGGMGTVLLARDDRLLRHVAIKRLNHTIETSKRAQQRFWQEAKAVAALNHIHIVHIYSLSEDDAGPYIVMEYVPGPAAASPGKTPPAPYNLADRVHRDGPLPLPDALDVMSKVGRAIEYAHSCGLIHRDLKPPNILFDASSEPKIVDFGLARKATPEVDRLTLPGDMMLSLGYSAPEQEADPGAVDIRADVYSLGALLFFSITGKNPRYFRPDDVPEALRMCIVKALETDRNQRWGSAREFLDAIDQIAAPESIVLPNSKSTWRCKWCDTVNPVVVQFCGKCGWDGGTACLECGSQTRIGVPFCGDCGADAREYETASRLLAQLRESSEQTAFEQVVHRAGSIETFRPVGPKGQQMVAEVNSLLASARKSIQRRDRLRDSIKRNLADGKRDTVLKQVQEYNTLSKDKAFEEAVSKLSNPELDRCLNDVRKFEREENWRSAADAATRILRGLEPGNREAEMVLERARKHLLRDRAFNGAAIGLGVVLFYLLSAAPAYRILGRPQGGSWHAFYAPAEYMHRTPVLGAALKLYASVWRSPNMFIIKTPLHTQPTPPPTPTPDPKTGEVLAELKAAHAERRAKIAADAGKWPEQYAAELIQLLKRMQEAGDYEGWVATQSEIERFEASPTLDETITHPHALPELLAALRDKYCQAMTAHSAQKKRKKLKEDNDYLKRLTAMQTDLTKKGLMKDAALVNAAITSKTEQMESEAAKPDDDSPEEP